MVEDECRRWRAQLVRRCEGYLHSAADAEDAAQEALLRFVRAAGEMDAWPDERKKAWLWRTAANVCRDMLRRRALARGGPFAGALPHGDAAVLPRRLLLAGHRPPPAPAGGHGAHPAGPRAQKTARAFRRGTTLNSFFKRKAGTTKKASAERMSGGRLPVFGKRGKALSEPPRGPSYRGRSSAPRSCTRPAPSRGCPRR